MTPLKKNIELKSDAHNSHIKFGRTNTFAIGVNFKEMTQMNVWLQKIRTKIRSLKDLRKLINLFIKRFTEPERKYFKNNGN